MASPWIRVDTNLPSHPKLGRLATALKLPDYAAIGVIAAIWLWAKTHRPNGDLGGVDPTDLAWAIRWDHDPQALFDALTQSQFIVDGHLTGWDEYQITPEQSAEKRAAAGRWGAHKRHHEGKGITDPDCEFCDASHLDTQTGATSTPAATQKDANRYPLGTQQEPNSTLEATQKEPTGTPIGTQENDAHLLGTQKDANRYPLGTQQEPNSEPVADQLANDGYPLAKLATKTETETKTIHTPLKPPQGGENQPEEKPAKKPKAAALTPDQEAEFETWWKSYPTRDGKRLGKAETRAEWARLTIAERQRATIGVANYAASDHGQFYAKDPVRFLRKNRHGTRFFDEWQTPAEHQPKPANGNPTGIDWQGIEANHSNEAYWFLDGSPAPSGSTT